MTTQQPTTITLDMFTRVHESLHRVFADVTEDELHREPHPGMGWLAWRFTRVIDNNISRLSGRDQLWAGEGWHAKFGMEPNPYDFGRNATHNREQVRAFRAGRDLILAYHDATHERTVAYLQSLKPEDYDRALDEPQYQPLPTVGVRLVSVLENAMHNMGQISYLKAYHRLGGWFPSEATGGAVYR
jgi:DinB superfamily